jgi:hypothetical protein
MIPLAIAGAFVALQIAATASGQYGYFIDELYYARAPSGSHGDT